MAWRLLFIYSVENAEQKGRDNVTPFGQIDTVRLLHEGMRVADFNQRLIANNIANVDTPNYNAVTIDFLRTLRRSLEGMGMFSIRKTDPRHLESNRPRPAIEHVASLSKNDYNKVDLENEILKLLENTGRYTTYGSLLAKKFQTIKTMLAKI